MSQKIPGIIAVYGSLAYLMGQTRAAFKRSPFAMTILIEFIGDRWMPASCQVAEPRFNVYANSMFAKKFSRNRRGPNPAKGIEYYLVFTRCEALNDPDYKLHWKDGRVAEPGFFGGLPYIAPHTDRIPLPRATIQVIRLPAGRDHPLASFLVRLPIWLGLEVVRRQLELPNILYIQVLHLANRNVAILPHASPTREGQALQFGLVYHIRPSHKLNSDLLLALDIEAELYSLLHAFE